MDAADRFLAILFGLPLMFGVLVGLTEATGYLFLNNKPDYCYVEWRSNEGFPTFTLEQHRKFGSDLVLIKTQNPQELGPVAEAFCP